MSMRCKAAIVVVLAAMMLVVMPAAPVMARMPESITAVPSPQVDPLRAFEPSIGDGRSEAATGSPDMRGREGTATDPWEMAPGSDDATGTLRETQTPRGPSRDDTATATGTVLPARETTPSPPVSHGFSDHSVMYPDAVGDAGTAIEYGVDGTEKTYVLRRTRDSESAMGNADQPQKEAAATPTGAALSASGASRAISVEGAATPRRSDAAAKTTQRSKVRLDEEAETDSSSTGEDTVWGRVAAPWRPGRIKIPPATLASIQLETRSDRSASALFDT